MAWDFTHQKKTNKILMQFKNSIRKIVRRMSFRRRGGQLTKVKYLLDDLRRDEAKFKEWQRRNPSKPLKDFAVEMMQVALEEGKPQPSLGARLHSGPYEKAGASYFHKLIHLGLGGNDTCVDYGCGTLRVGQHVMGYLGRGKYWGLDIAQRLLDEGESLIGPAVLSEKEPRLRVISSESVAEAAAAKPTILYSHRVLPHVHPNDLAEYFGNILTIIGRSGQAIIDGKWTEGDTIQYRLRAWAHSASYLRALISRMDGAMLILNEKSRPLPIDGGRYSKGGLFRLVHKSSHFVGESSASQTSSNEHS